MYSYLFDSTKTHHPATHSVIHILFSYSYIIYLVIHILQGSVESSKVSLSGKTPQERTPQFGNRGSEGF